VVGVWGSLDPNFDSGAPNGLSGSTPDCTPTSWRASWTFSTRSQGVVGYLQITGIQRDPVCANVAFKSRSGPV
jgi:hypothetical protein